jgi:hypothetical protein
MQHIRFIERNSPADEFSKSHLIEARVQFRVRPLSNEHEEEHQETKGQKAGNPGMRSGIGPNLSGDF